MESPSYTNLSTSVDKDFQKLQVGFELGYTQG